VVYVARAKDAKPGKDPLVLYQCPVSAIPSEVWELLHLWHSCRLMGTLPVAGAYMDQPKIVQLVFPVFEALMRGQEQVRQHHGTATAVAGTMAAMFGGGKP
jgi:hypothetical protein